MSADRKRKCDGPEMLWREDARLEGLAILNARRRLALSQARRCLGGPKRLHELRAVRAGRWPGRRTRMPLPRYLRAITLAQVAPGQSGRAKTSGRARRPPLRRAPAHRR